jgi:hypothetical protein
LSPATSLGFSAIQFAEDVVGMKLIPWQRWLFIHALELKPDGRFRFRTLLVLVARQNGKTSLVEIKNLWKLFVLRVLLVIGTAQTLEYAEESWDKAVEIVEAIPDLFAEVKHVDKTNGKKTLRLHGGPRWKIATATRRGGRSLSGDDVNLDELREHQNWDSWGAVTKTTMARPNAQTWAFSNAGDDKSVVLNELLEQARGTVFQPERADASLGLFEWSAPASVKCTCGRPDGVHRGDCRLQDRGAWAQANPSLGHTITEEAIASALGTDPVAVFRTEVLCQRVENLIDEWQVIPEAEWLTAEDASSHTGVPVAAAIEVDLARTQAAIAVAGRRAEDKSIRHVYIRRAEPGTAWVVADLQALMRETRVCAVVIDPGGPAGSLIPDVEAAGIEVVKPTVRALAGACGAMRDGIAGKAKDGEDLAAVRNIRHMGQAPLTSAVAGLATRKGSETEVWERAGLGFLAVAAAEALLGHAMKAPESYDPLNSVLVGGER